MAKGSGGVGKGASVSGGKGAASGALTPASAEKAITRAYLSLTGGEYTERVMLADLRPKLGLTREDFDSTVKSMQQQGKLVLMGLDNPFEKTKRVTDAGLDIAGHGRYLVRFHQPKR